MEANICCAYNLSRDCKVSSKVAAADCGNEPFKLMKLMLDGLAKDQERGFWLTHLTHGPQIVRLFPFDFVYLDSELRIVQALELPAEAMLPRFHARAASALILPLHSLASSGTAEGDRLIICAENELEERIAAVAPEPKRQATPVEAYTAISVERPEPRTSPLPAPATASIPAPPIALPRTALPVSIPPAAAIQGTGYTVALTSTWQISNSTTAGALLDPVDAEEVQEANDTPLPVDTGAPEEIQLHLADEPALDAADEPIFLKPINRDAASAPKEDPPPEPHAIIEAKPDPVLALEKSGTGAQTGKTAVKIRELPAKVAEGKLTLLDTDFAGTFDLEDPEDLNEITGLEDLDVIAEEVESLNAPDLSIATADRPPQPDSALVATISQNPSPRATEQAVESEPELARKFSSARTAAIEPKKTAQPEGGGARNKAAASASGEETKAAKPKLQEAQKPRSPRQVRKRSFGILVKEFLNCPDPLPEERSHPRLVQQGMVAYERAVNGPLFMEVRDMSPTGLFLRTKKRWQLGKVLALTLQIRDSTESDYQRSVDVKAKVVRCDEDGVGLSWILPNGFRFDPWKRLHTKRSDESDIQFFIREIRLAKAESFLQRICPTATDQIKHALHERLSNKRVASAVEIALKAEKLVATRGSGSQGTAHPEVVTRVIENGSWIEDDWIRKMWAGLLVSSCTIDGDDRSNLPFLDLLARLTPIHLRIFAFACERATKALAEGEPEATLDLHSTAEELMEAADSHSFQRIQQTVGHLCNFGLLKDSARPSYAAIDDNVRTRTTPSALGLKMYAHCNGRR